MESKTRMAVGECRFSELAWPFSWVVVLPDQLYPCLYRLDKGKRDAGHEEWWNRRTVLIFRHVEPPEQHDGFFPVVSALSPERWVGVGVWPIYLSAYMTINTPSQASCPRGSPSMSSHILPSQPFTSTRRWTNIRRMHINHTPTPPKPLIPTPIHHPPDPNLPQRRRAHHARLHRHVQRDL